jgi:hypothetical protein
MMPRWRVVRRVQNGLFIERLAAHAPPDARQRPKNPASPMSLPCWLSIIGAHNLNLNQPSLGESTGRAAIQQAGAGTIGAD